MRIRNWDAKTACESPTTSTRSTTTSSSIHPHQSVWLDFAQGVYDHIADTKKGHYVRSGAIEPLEFMESYLDMDWIVGQVIKYACRAPKTRNPKDLYKAAHYLSRLALQLAQKPKKEQI